MTEPTRLDPPSVGAGWYADPWHVAHWRWWDGHSWTAHTGSGPDAEHKPRLPGWLSVPVVAFGIIAVPLVALLLFSAPFAVLLGLTPLVIVLPVFAWLDRVEPEPWSARIHALLWGATVAGVTSGIINTVVGLATNETIAAVVSAPLVEEATKALGIYWAVRRNQVDSVMDGIVYAGWVALGFAVVEDFLYFAEADDQGFLVQVFILRALLTPFAHPLFTAWTGLGIGLAVARNKPVALGLIAGLIPAVGTHAAWNGSLAYAESTGNDNAVAIAALAFVALFIAAAIAVFVIRRKQQQRFVAAIPFLASRYHLAQNEIAVFGNWSVLLQSRRRLPRADRAKFDAVHASLARLALLHERPGPTDTVAEQRLADQLNRARSAAV
ncbi:MAG: PrsW family glutamic-type intramembrane protease [Acidimicrobiales bacterium]